MTNLIDFADELEDAANQIADINRADLQIILRRSAIWLRNTEGLALGHDVDEAVAALAAELSMTRHNLLRIMIREWLETGGYLPVRALEEDGEVDGSA
ncbi:ribbon-helix-helix protein, CopG family [Aminobacter sp. NyZ550]|uniref:ribbon-helix-helix protein, CopG family n=1 Tax=Aminobacter sp. NyZ550 TaxID=2979870 RepID=UPI0021D5EB5B|nr:ribbon-helix-helix protein, CopG family [Aminobacter sp. NyZ550]WAX93600.1 ribbon-helix-helix protein, CopG family [Aminobacter sp. NyZ550]